MPNWCTVDISMDGPQDIVQKIMEEVQYDEDIETDSETREYVLANNKRFGSFNFYKIVSVPEELKEYMEEYTHSPFLYIHAINPNTEDYSKYGVSKVSQDKFDRIYEKWKNTADRYSDKKRPKSLSAENIQKILSAVKERVTVYNVPPDRCSTWKDIKTPSLKEFLENGKSIIDRIIKYDVSNIHSFISKKIGTKWNSHYNSGGYNEETGKWYFFFVCPWNPPYYAIQTLSEKYPEVTFNVSFHSDDPYEEEGSWYIMKSGEISEASWDINEKHDENWWEYHLEDGIDEWVETTVIIAETIQAMEKARENARKNQENSGLPF